ncbi:MAG TPA: BamA/TamA family outer membrane protein [Candidatus Aminicenantes bacterium]|mgnify:CR=1 FL=1|nr:BamA/TamA family outer membrane protein [Candidatus Aminicenantes bacterium]
MKRGSSASTFTSAVAISLSLWGLLTARPAWAAASDQTVRKILIEVKGPITDQELNGLRLLLPLREGAPFNRRLLREGMDHINQTGLFSDIDAHSAPAEGGGMVLRLTLNRRYRLKSVRFRMIGPGSGKNVAQSVFSVKKNDIYDPLKVERAIAEIKAFLLRRGYPSAQVQAHPGLRPDDRTARLTFSIVRGPARPIGRIELSVDPLAMKPSLEKVFAGIAIYAPAAIEDRVERLRRLLKKKRHYFPEITVDDGAESPGLGPVDLKVTVKCGYQYQFVFVGIHDRSALITDIWEKKVFEKWAEEESRARLIQALKNEGYLNVAVQSKIREEGTTKRITFTVSSGSRFSLGKVRITGNRAFSTKQLLGAIRVDDLLFEKIFWLRTSVLQSDLDSLRQFYVEHGYPGARIGIIPQFGKKQAEIEIRIDEGKRITIDQVVFAGNRSLPAATLLPLVTSSQGTPFQQRRIDGDVSRLLAFYQQNGFDHVEIAVELSPGEAKTLLFRIVEGKREIMGQLITVGASDIQAHLLARQFPLRKGAPYDRRKVDQFLAEMEASAIFNEIHLSKVPTTSEVVDVLVRVIPDRNRSYGFGLGWEERKGLRGTLEYQEKNLFNTTTHLSSLFQIGLNERRGILALEWPYLFHRKLNTSWQFWEEDEAFPSYEFVRTGIGASVIRRLGDKLTMVGSLKWYRTKLTDLTVPESGVDRLHTPFDTTALTLSLTRESRDDPFNPTRGTRILADMKIGLPLVQQSHTFLKLYWSYQQHFPLLKHGVFSAAVRNGLGWGDMSITERFFSGGPNSFRGTRIDRLGPIFAGTGKPIGGNALLIFNFEATFPLSLVPVNNVYYAFFCDVGNVFPHSTDFNLSSLERAYGIGLRYRTALGPLRLDLAWNPHPVNGSRKLQFFIGIGNAY